MFAPSRIDSRSRIICFFIGNNYYPASVSLLGVVSSPGLKFNEQRDGTLLWQAVFSVAYIFVCLICLPVQQRGQFANVKTGWIRNGDPRCLESKNERSHSSTRRPTSFTLRISGKTGIFVKIGLTTLHLVEESSTTKVTSTDERFCQSSRAINARIIERDPIKFAFSYARLKPISNKHFIIS